jgi:hypothetical protein
MVREWQEFPTLSHGFAVPAIAGFLLWRGWTRAHTTTPAPSALGFPLLVAGLLTLIIGVHGTLAVRW